MRSGWFMSALVLLASVSAERGAAAAGRGIVNPTKTTEPARDNADEQQKVSAIKAAYAAGKYDEAIAAATTFQRITKDGKLRAEAGRVVADSLRKKKDWKRACSAYIMLRDRFPKGSDEYFKYHAMAEILRASPRGVYGQAVARDSESTPNPGPTLDDDAAMAEALSRLVAARVEKMKFRMALIKGARTAQQVIQRFMPLAVELRQLRILWPEMPSDRGRVAAQAAAMRMAQISSQTVAGLESKQAAFEEAKKKKRFTSSHQQEMLRCQGICKDMAKAEESLTAGMDELADTAAWPEGEKLKADSASRRETFEQLVKKFVPPKLSGRGGSGTRWGSPGWKGSGGAGGRGLP